MKINLIHLFSKIRFKKLRLWVAYPFIFLYFALGLRTGFRLIPGILLVFAGMFVRVWASGLIKKRRKLTVSGPYSYTRNPLYLGSFLAGIGFCLFVNNILLTVAFVLVFYILYAGTIKEEEILLTTLFSQDYLDYKNAVPVFLPGFKRYHSTENSVYSLTQVYINGEIIRVMACALLIWLVYTLQYFLDAGLSNIIQIQKIIIVFIFLVFGFWLSIVLRKKCLRNQGLL